MKCLLFILSVLIFISCAKDLPTDPFRSYTVEETGISFTNRLTDTKAFNILEYLYYYNGAGVATGDVNNDGLPDIYFASNQGEDELYLNRGNLKFEKANDLLPKSHLGGWSTGVNIVDIDGDGWLDIYVCRLGAYKGYEDCNKLFINQAGKGFKESSKEYGLDFSGFGTHSAFFDYDRDGDLDCYLLNHSVKGSEVFKDASIRSTIDTLAGDRLYENKGQRFVDVTSAAGIYSSALGFGLGISVADLNDDGWLDIYVGNDFHEQDYLYLNQGDRTFKEHIQSATGHTSNFTMGTSVADLNNDGKPDLFTLDMKPMDERVYKQSGGWENMQIYNYKRSFGYHHQSPRNALQINMGAVDGIPQFSEQASHYGLAATDWSWSSLIFDMDNDGDKDIFVANGIVRRPNDLDFVDFIFNDSKLKTLEKIALIPSGAVPNVLFENKLQQQEYKRTYVGLPSICTGAAVADFNNDGQLDLVLNNINAPSTLLINKANKQNSYLAVQLVSQSMNSQGLGAKLSLYSGPEKQTITIGNSMGFMSCSAAIAHFGLANSKVDSLEILWSDGATQLVFPEAVDTMLTIVQTKGIAKAKKISDKKKTGLAKVEVLKGYADTVAAFSGQLTNKWLLFNEATQAGFFHLENSKISICKGSEKVAIINPLNDNLQATESKLSILPPGLQEQLAAKEILIYRTTQGHYASHKVFIATAEEQLIYTKNSTGGFDKIQLESAGQITDAAWGDMNGDMVADLVMVGNWRPITIYYIDGNKYRKKTISETSGLWFEVQIADINGDDKLDILGGNFGTNHSIKVSAATPMRTYENDFDRNGSQEKLMTYIVDGKEVPYVNQNLFVSQLPYAKKHFLSNVIYAQATIDELFTSEQIAEAKKQEVVELRSCVFIQGSNGAWAKKPLPPRFQQAPIFAMDFDDHGRWYTGGNLYEVDPNWGRQDAGYLSAFHYKPELDSLIDLSKDLPLISGEIRAIHWDSNKLYLYLRGDSVKVVYLPH